MHGDIEGFLKWVCCWRLIVACNQREGYSLSRRLRVVLDAGMVQGLCPLGKTVIYAQGKCDTLRKGKEKGPREPCPGFCMGFQRSPEESGVCRKGAPMQC